MTQAKLQAPKERRILMIKREIMIWIREMKIIELKIPTFVIVMQLLMIVILQVFQMLRMFQTQLFLFIGIFQQQMTKNLKKKKAPPVRKDTPKKAYAIFSTLARGSSSSVGLCRLFSLSCVEIVQFQLRLP